MIDDEDLVGSLVRLWLYLSDLHYACLMIRPGTKEEFSTVWTRNINLSLSYVIANMGQCEYTAAIFDTSAAHLRAPVVIDSESSAMYQALGRSRSSMI